MPIKVTCSCGQNFAARDNMGGKTVKCPKCQRPLQIPRAAPRPIGKKKPAAAQVQPAGKTKPQPAPRVPAPAGDLGDLFDEIGVAAAPAASGPPCPSCGKGLKPGAVMCVECGFNLQTGQRMGSSAPVVADDHDPHSSSSQAEAMIAKAAREIAETPISAEGEDFGEGSNPLAWLLAISLPLLFLLAMFAVIQWGSGLGLFLDVIWFGVSNGNPIVITFGTLCLLCFCVTMVTWFKLTFTAMEEHVLLGLLCIVGLGLAPSIYGFVRYKKLLFWSIAYVVSSILLGMFFVIAYVAAMLQQGLQNTG